MESKTAPTMKDSIVEAAFKLSAIQLIDLLPCYITVQDSTMHIVFSIWNALEACFRDKKKGLSGFPNGF